ncbi:MAG TPA: hypothetical protein VK934_00515 [Fimbriimonas sp.]|nr:hypothetical protein [Fimbriimonas sp.]
MRAFSLLLLGCASFASADSADYRLIVGGKQVGTVRTSLKFDKTGFFEESTAKVTQQGKTFSIFTKTQLDANGNWVRKGIEMGSGTDLIKAFAVPKGKSALVMMQRAGKKFQAEVPQASKLPTTDTTARWFLTYKPKPGEEAKFQRFDMQRRQWSDVSVRYVGPKTVTLGGKQVAGFEAERSEYGRKSSVIYDAKGMPILLDSPDMRLERIYR